MAERSCREVHSDNRVFNPHIRGPYSHTPHLGLRFHKSCGDSEAGYIRCQGWSESQRLEQSRVEKLGPTPTSLPPTTPCSLLPPHLGAGSHQARRPIATVSSTGCCSKSNVLREHL